MNYVELKKANYKLFIYMTAPESIIKFAICEIKSR